MSQLKITNIKLIYLKIVQQLSVQVCWLLLWKMCMWVGEKVSAMFCLHYYFVDNTF